MFQITDWKLLADLLVSIINNYVINEKSSKQRD